MSKQGSTSFSVEKEAKRLSSILASSPGAKRMKVFWFFFSKKNPSFP
jgi:hypothetical protein